MVDERSRRFDEAYTAWRDRRSQHKRSADLLRMLLREYPKVWDAGDERGKVAVLLFVRDNAPPGGEQIVWSSLRSRKVHLVALGLAVAVGHVLHRHAQPSAKAVSDLMRIVRDDPIDSQRFMALHVLTLAEVEGLDSWLQELAQRDQSPSIRYEANIALMRRGDPRAKAALFEDLREHPGNFGVADELWQHRRSAKLTEDEEHVLRGAILRYMESMRQWLRRPDDRHMFVGMFGLYVQDGFPFDQDDVEVVGRFATSATDIDDRVDAVDTLAAFDTPRAWQWVAQLASSEQPKQVVRRARRVLKRQVK